MNEDKGLVGENKEDPGIFTDQYGNKHRHDPVEKKWVLIEAGPHIDKDKRRK